MGDLTITALKRLAYQYIDSEEFKEFMSAFLSEFEELAASNLQLLNERYLDTSVGVQLDGIGEIVGQLRPEGYNDDIYRLLIRGKIVQNRTSQTVEETIEILLFIFPTSTIRYFLSAHLEATYELCCVTTDEEAAILLELPLLLGIGSAVYVTSPDDYFGFSDDPNALGFGDDTNPTVGGNFAKIIQ